MSFKLSQSSINLMLECSRCFWLTQHGKWSRPPTISSSLPNGIDFVLKKHFDKFIGKNTLPPELRKSECRDYKLFDDRMLLQLWRDSRHGISFMDTEGNVLHGAIDNLLVKNDKLIILDYKTRGFPLKDNTHDYYKNQLDIYTFLLQKNGYPTEDFAFLLFYYPQEVLENGEIFFESKLVKVPIDLDNAKSLWKSAVDMLNGPCPQDKCVWCQSH